MARSDDGRARHGQVLVIAPVMIIALCLVAMLSIDVGHLCTSKARLQNSADAGALAAALELWYQRAHHDSSDETSCRVAASNEGDAIVLLNESGSRCEVEWGAWNNGTFTPLYSSHAANAARVRAVRDPDAPGGSVGTFFAHLAGLSSLDQGARAVAVFRHPGMVPFALDEEALVPPGQPLTMYDDTETAPGNCGLLDFDGGTNSAADTKYWTRYGYEGNVYIDPLVGFLTMNGTTGLQSSIASSLDYHISEGDTIVCCIYRSVTGVGSLAEYTLVGYAALVITGYEWADKKEEDLLSVAGTLVGSYIVDSGATEGELSGFMLLQLVE